MSTYLSAEANGYNDIDLVYDQDIYQQLVVAGKCYTMVTTEHTQDKFRTIQIAATVRIMNAATLSFFYMNWESLCFHRHSLENKSTQVQILHLEIDQITSLSLFVLKKFYSPSLDFNREKFVRGITANRTSIWKANSITRDSKRQILKGFWVMLSNYSNVVL